MKPNVILITTDQQRKDSLGCYGSNFVHTPYLDQMAREGILFHRAYCTSPVCTPSRATLYSGTYVGNHGAWNVGTEVHPDQKLLSQYFNDANYRTHHIGKAHFTPYLADPEISIESTQPGWEANFEDFNGPYYGFQSVELCMGHTLYGIRGHYGKWVKERTGKTEFPATSRSTYKFGGEAYDWDIPEDVHNSNWTAERAAAFLRTSAAHSDQPFFLSIGFEDPHHPHALPLERSKDIRTEEIPLPQFSPGELDDKPQHFQDVHKGVWGPHHELHGDYPMAGQNNDGSDYRLVPDEDARLGKAYYYKMVEMIDEAVGKILETLEELKLSENTIVIFTSDHGELLGDHGIWMKGPFHYEQLINVPLIIQWKGQLQEGSIDSIVSLVDIAPTVLSLCGLDVPEYMDGMDAAALLNGSEKLGREHALVECIDDPRKLRLKTLVTDQYKMTCYYGDYGRQYGELYDLSSDPGEIRNLWNEPSAATIKEDMFLRLLHELEHLETRAQRICYA